MVRVSGRRRPEVEEINFLPRDGEIRETLDWLSLLLTQDDGAKGLDRAKGEGFSLQISTTQSADSLAARARRQGAVLEAEPTDMPRGPRIFRVRDPDGFRWTSSSAPRPGSSD